MRLFFKRSSAVETPPAAASAATATEELPAVAEQSPVEPSPSAPEAKLGPAPPPFPIFAPKKNLVSASELPSAADALAQLFDESTPAPLVEAPDAALEAQLADPEREPVSQPQAETKARLASLPAPAAVETHRSLSYQPELVLEPNQSPEIPAFRLEIADQQQPVEIIAGAAQTESQEIPRGSSAASSSHHRIDSSDLVPEDAATILAAASEELRADEALPSMANQQATAPSHAIRDSAPAAPDFPMSASNWEFEEILAGHREWVDSNGNRGKKADLANADLAGIELINVNLRFADLHYADLKSADLLLADLRDACMVRADLEEACLVGANLEGANLEGASMETALGLVPRQLAGTNLREASLPALIAQFPAAAIFRAAARDAVRFFAAIMALSAAFALAIWKTKDIQLVTDSAILPFLHSAKAAAAMPTAEIFLIAPVALFLLYLAFLANMQRAWGAALELPAVFPDGTSLGEKEPWIVIALLRAQFRWMNQEGPSARTLETTISVLLAYWTVPIMLFLFWARYLTLQEIHGTILHELLASIAAGVAVHATFKVGRPHEKWTLKRTLASRIAGSLRESKPPVLVGILLAITTFITFGTLSGVPHDLSRAPQYGPTNIRRWAPTALWSIGYDPYADLTEAQISTPPRGWNWSDETVGSVRGVHLNDPRFRYAQAYGAFLANARLWHADFRGAYLSNSDFRAADLTQSNFQFAVLDDARFGHANLDRSTLQGGHFARTDFRNANLSYGALAGAFLMDARFDGASLYDAVLSNGTLVRAVFEHADLRNSHIDAANLDHADLRNAYLWSASLQNSDMKDADLGAAILIGANLRGSNLSGAHFAQTVLDETDLTGAILDNADLRGAFGLTARQVCSAHSYTGASFDDALQLQINTACPPTR